MDQEKSRMNICFAMLIDLNDMSHYLCPPYNLQ